MVDPQSSIEHKLVVGCSWLGALFCGVGVFTNWYLGGNWVLVWAVALSTVIFAAIAIAGARRVPTTRLSVAFLLNVAFLIASTWEANGGVRGSTTPAIAAAVVFSVLALPGRHARAAIALPLVLFLLLCALELRDGEPAALPFAGIANALDSLITTLTTSTLCGIGVAMMRRVYDRNLEQLRLAKIQIEELAARATLADREKTRFLARMSHDLRTPLAAVVGSLEIASHEPLRPQVVRLLTAARQRCDDLERMIGDLLDVGMLESGELALRMGNVDLVELLEIAVAEARPLPGVSVSLHVDADVPRRIWTDSTRLRQVLGNLLSNACKHTDRGQVEVTLRRRSDHLLCTVTDTGPGVDDADLARLFQPFSQLARGRERGGTGLGLFISRQIAAALGGNLGLLPGIKGGAVAELVLPCREPRETSKLSTDQIVPMRGNLQVLIADDEPVLVLIMKEMFESLGCQVVAVSDGAAAVAKARIHDFDLIFLDLCMPVLDGLAAARQIRSFKPRQWLVALTANAYPEDQQSAFEAGMNAFMPKPVTMERLHSLLDRHRRANGQRESEPAQLLPDH